MIWSRNGSIPRNRSQNLLPGSTNHPERESFYDRHNSFIRCNCRFFYGLTAAGCHFCRAMHIAAIAVMRTCLSVCVSITFVDSVKTNKRIFKIFAPSGSQTILFFFSYQTAWQHSDGNPLTGALNAGGLGRNRDSEPISGFAACCQCCDRPGVINTMSPRTTVPQVLTLIAPAELVDGRRRRRNVYDKMSQRYAKDNRTAHLIARSDKSVAYVTNNKRLYTPRFVLL